MSILASARSGVDQAFAAFAEFVETASVLRYADQNPVWNTAGGGGLEQQVSESTVDLLLVSFSTDDYTRMSVVTGDVKALIKSSDLESGVEIKDGSKILRNGGETWLVISHTKVPVSKPVLYILQLRQQNG